MKKLLWLTLLAAAAFAGRNLVSYHIAVQPSLPHFCDPARIFMFLTLLQATDPSIKPTLPPRLPRSAEV